MDVMNSPKLPTFGRGNGDRLLFGGFIKNQPVRFSGFAPFLGKEEFVKKVAPPKRPNGATRPAKLEVLLKAGAREARLEPQAVARRGKSRTIGEVRRGFVEVAVLEQGYQASEIAGFLGRHASNVSRALQKWRSKS